MKPPYRLKTNVLKFLNLFKGIFMVAIPLCLLLKKVQMCGWFTQREVCNKEKWMSLPPTSAAQAIGILNLLFRLASAECTGIPQ
jgi:hypothetical protein